MSLTGRARVLSAVKRAGAKGLTDEQIAQRTGLSSDTVRSRRLELYLRGLIDEAPFMRRTTRGRNAVVWVVGKGESDAPH